MIFWSKTLMLFIYRILIPTIYKPCAVETTLLNSCLHIAKSASKSCPRVTVKSRLGRLFLSPCTSYIHSEINSKQQHATRFTHLWNSNQVLGVDQRQVQLLDRQPEAADRDAGHVLRPDLHLGQEAVDQVNGREQDVVRQLVPNLEAAQHVGGTVARSDGDFAILEKKGGGRKLIITKFEQDNYKRMGWKIKTIPQEFMLLALRRDLTTLVSTYFDKTYKVTVVRYFCVYYLIL